MSPRISSTTRLWAPVSWYGSRNLAVSSPVVCEALREGASAIQLEEIDRENSAEGVVGFSRERRKRRIALATALDEQLEEGRAVVDVPVEVADGVARIVAEVIREDALLSGPPDLLFELRVPPHVVDVERDAYSFLKQIT